MNLFPQPRRSLSRIIPPCLLLGALWTVLPATSRAVDTISTITTVTTNFGASTLNTTGAGGNVLDLNPNDAFTLNYAGNMRTLAQLTAGGVQYAVVPVSYTVNLVRNASQPENNILWHSYSSITPNPSSGIQTFTVELPGLPENSMEAAFSSGSLDTGTDNLFVNAGDANGNMNNIERLDVLYNGGITSSSALVFPIIERGATSGHDAFKMAAILSVDINGIPTSYGPLLSVARGWGNSSLGTANVLVERNLTTDPGGTADYVSAYTNQFLGGTTINALTDLGVASGQGFFGYSLFGADVLSSDNLLDPNTFPTNTPNTDTGGGVDMLGSFQAFHPVPVPEPGSLGLAMGCMALGAFRRRRQG